MNMPFQHFEYTIILCEGNILIIFTVSSSVVFPEPNLIVPPIETSFGILLTKISSIARLVVIDFVGAVKNTRDVLIPILWEFVNPKIEVAKPETRTLSSLFKSINGKNFAFTSLLLTQVNTISSNVLRFVLIEDTPRPTISLTSALKPVPFVPVLSKDVRSPTLYPV